MGWGAPSLRPSLRPSVHPLALKPNTLTLHLHQKLQLLLQLQRQLQIRLQLHRRGYGGGHTASARSCGRFPPSGSAPACTTQCTHARTRTPHTHSLSTVWHTHAHTLSHARKDAPLPAPHTLTQTNRGMCIRTPTHARSNEGTNTIKRRHKYSYTRARLSLQHLQSAHNFYNCISVIGYALIYLPTHPLIKQYKVSVRTFKVSVCARTLAQGEGARAAGEAEGKAGARTASAAPAPT